MREALYAALFGNRNLEHNREYERTPHIDSVNGAYHTSSLRRLLQVTPLSFLRVNVLMDWGSF